VPREAWASPGEKILEIGPGKGEFILSLAQQYPQTRFLGVELKKGRYLKLAQKIHTHQLTNLFLVWGDARECLPRLLPEGAIDRVFILFPDPWPKSRHAKHRLLNHIFINDLRYILKPNGEVYSATDAGEYAAEICESFASGHFDCEPIDSPYPTYFEKKWKALDRQIQYWRFTKL
jgi:tRNA (guanine-N7-)-methyltransferase